MTAFSLGMPWIIPAVISYYSWDGLIKAKARSMVMRKIHFIAELT
jgi:hypothetical protein